MKIEITPNGEEYEEFKKEAIRQLKVELREDMIIEILKEYSSYGIKNILYYVLRSKLQELFNRPYNELEIYDKQLLAIWYIL